MRLRRLTPIPVMAALVATVTHVEGRASQPKGVEPYLSVLTGYKCSQCHVNVTGGGMRNSFGVVYAQTQLPMTFWAPSPEGNFFSRQAGEFLALGGDGRLDNLTRFNEDVENDNAFQISEGNVYIEAQVIPDILSLYFDETLAPGGARNREALLILRSLPGEIYVKAGNLLLPFGFRLLDDEEFIRQQTGFNYDNSDLGVEVGAEPGPFAVSVAVSNGTQGAAEDNQAKQVSATAAAFGRRGRVAGRVGGSFSRNEGPDATRRVFGPFAGISFYDRLALLGEVDWIKDEQEPRDRDQFSAFVEGDLLLSKGLNLKVTYGFFDPDQDIGENARTRVRIGLEPFLTQFLQVSVFYAIRDDIPQGLNNADELTAQLHVFF